MISYKIIEYIYRDRMASTYKYSFMWSLTEKGEGLVPLSCLCNMVCKPELAVTLCFCVSQVSLTCPVECFVYPTGGHRVKGGC